MWHLEEERATSVEFKQVSHFMTESVLSGTSKPYQSLFLFLVGRVLVIASQSKRRESGKFCLIIISLDAYTLLSCRSLRKAKKRINYIVIPGGIAKAPKVFHQLVSTFDSYTLRLWCLDFKLRHLYKYLNGIYVTWLNNYISKSLNVWRVNSGTT